MHMCISHLYISHWHMLQQCFLCPRPLSPLPPMRPTRRSRWRRNAATTMPTSATSWVAPGPSIKGPWHFTGGWPSGKQPHNYGKSPFLMGKLTISIVIFNSYVKLPEGMPNNVGKQCHKPAMTGNGYLLWSGRLFIIFLPSFTRIIMLISVW